MVLRATDYSVIYLIFMVHIICRPCLFLCICSTKYVKLLFLCIYFRLNDLVAISDKEFYFTNCLYASPFEIPLLLKWGSVGFYDGAKSKIVASGYFMPNGINISPDGRLVIPRRHAGITPRKREAHNSIYTQYFNPQFRLNSTWIHPRLER